MKEYNVAILTSSGEISAKLLLSRDRLIFEPDWLRGEREEIPVDKIKDVRFAIQEDIKIIALKLPLLWKDIHKILLIDFEDKSGILQHLTLKGGNEIADIEAELHKIRKKRKVKPKNNLRASRVPEV